VRFRGLIFLKLGSQKGDYKYFEIFVATCLVMDAPGKAVFFPVLPLSCLDEMVSV